MYPYTCAPYCGCSMKIKMDLEIESPDGDKLGVCNFETYFSCYWNWGSENSEFVYQICYQNGSMFLRDKESAKDDPKASPITPTPVVCPPCGKFCQYAVDKGWLFEKYFVPTIFARWFQRWGLPLFSSTPLVLKEFTVKTTRPNLNDPDWWKKIKITIEDKECCCYNENREHTEEHEIRFDTETRSTRELMPHNNISVVAGDKETACGCGEMAISQILSCNPDMAELIARMIEEEKTKCVSQT